MFGASCAPYCTTTSTREYDSLVMAPVCCARARAVPTSNGTHLSREVYGKPKLGAGAGAGDVLAAQNTEVQAQSFPQLVFAADEGLQLTLAQIEIAGYATVKLAAELETGRHFTDYREAAREDSSARGLNPDEAGAGIAGEEDAGVGGNSRGVAYLFLGDSVQPIIHHS